jgi:ABC-type nitrate/sulfonate/bicarbonate transport system substrate-binding protein
MDRAHVFGCIMLSALLLPITPVAAQTTVKIGGSGGLNTGIQPLLYAQSAELFKKHGLEADITQMTDDTTAIQGLISGAFDLLYTGAGTGMIAIAKGADIKIVDSFSPWTDYQFVARPDVRSLKDMEGKVLGVSKLGSLSHLAPMFAFRKEGVDASKIQIVAVGNDATRGQALSAKTIDGAVINGIIALTALKLDKSLHVVYDVGSTFREQSVSTALFARGEMIRNNPKVVQATVDALIESSRALMSDEKVAIAQAIKSGLPADAAEGAYGLLFKAPAPFYGVDGGIDPAAIAATVALLKETGDIEPGKAIGFPDTVEKRFVDDAMRRMGPFRTP